MKNFTWYGGKVYHVLLRNETRYQQGKVSKKYSALYSLTKTVGSTLQCIYMLWITFSPFSRVSAMRRAGLMAQLTAHNWLLMIDCSSLIAHINWSPIIACSWLIVHDRLLIIAHIHTRSYTQTDPPTKAAFTIIVIVVNVFVGLMLTCYWKSLVFLLFSELQQSFSALNTITGKSMFNLKYVALKRDSISLHQCDLSYWIHIVHCYTWTDSNETRHL